MSSAVEEGKKKAAYIAVDKFVQDNQKIGIGSGSTIVYAVDRLAERVSAEGLRVQCVPTSFQARQLVTARALPLTDLEQCPRLDLAIDGADEVDRDRVCIKGGGGCLAQEKIVAAAAQRFVVIADTSKRSQRLGDHWKRGVPIEVLPMAYRTVQLAIEGRHGGTAPLRLAKQKAGPVVTDNGNLLLDWLFPDGDHDWKTLSVQLKMIPGVVETGLFVDMAECVIFGGPDGTEELH
ncbi:ribose-5-phosphate isomerase-like isoform X2 [Amphibalanus amphitrite]|nr:ribose-5-phosphate isomerase-like isoform X2 [Amphibalanus amphitrite]XP_043206083.1 ribose-5-phosphate isomerase-like isoform X2 [Amphibalanus amphitrite]XP_043206084.1 ribose-5-phosphate isomerase-like isoform X2 [Amphibalanus amphitrite]XP_043206086.1 ribose-5-phosphate isomerase-like isoform X2 [Amphibalanus amphitrite]XP_043206087.1 ribose-5-phosphate isomerase-like isoform X2 [Amphibalanus amphitrite]